MGSPSTAALSRLRRYLVLFSAIFLAGAAAGAQEHPYTSIVVFGDSLSDTGNDADLTEAKFGVRVPGPYANYTDGRFTDGADTFPAAQRYFGVWIEQLSRLLPEQPQIKASLDGGKDYAYGFATTGNGTGVFTLNASGSEFVIVDNMGQQITEYLATHPRINDNTLFVVWGGAINVLYATSSEDVIEGAVAEAADVERLIQAGARRILVANLPPLGAIPRLNTTPSESATANAGSVLFNTTLATSLDIVQLLEFSKQPTLYRLDVFSLFTSVIADASSYQLDNVTRMSQGKLTVDPDKYLFWDDLHPTTKGHDILARAALKLLDPEKCQQDPTPYLEPSCAALPAAAASPK